MKIERLRNGRYKLIFLCGFILVVILLILSIVFKGSKAKYRNTQVIPLINGRVKNNVPSFTTMGIYLEDANGTEIKGSKKYTKQGDNVTIPSSGYAVNKANSYCEKYDASQDKSIVDTKAKLFTNEYGQHIVYGVSKGDKCYIYLDKSSITVKNLLGYWGYPDTSEITARTDFNTVRLDGGNKVYKAADDYGTSYYLVGNPQNNWVKFAGYYWRIVRINGDGSLRMIYQGESANTTAGTNYTTSKYLWEFRRAEYVGYMLTIDVQRGFDITSSLKGIVDKFYADNLNKEEVSKYIDKNAGFCNDRSTVTGNGFGEAYAEYGAYGRLNTNKTPILTCPSNDDLFTVSDAAKGNKKLTYPIGTITADEVAMGGLVFGSSPSTRNINMYDTGHTYWTMSPEIAHRANSYHIACMFIVSSGGDLGYYWVHEAQNVRPVINLIKDITFSKGDGTSTNPFEI